MVQAELQKEFQDLIKEISQEVLELSVSKSMVDASYTVKQQVPAMADNIGKLQKVLEGLQWVNSELTKYQQEAKAKETRLDTHMKTITQKVDSDIQLNKEVQEELLRFREETKKQFVQQEKAVKYSEDVTIRESEKLASKLQTLHGLTEEGVIIGLKTKTLLIWNFVFSFGSLGLLIFFLLRTLKVISF